MRAHQCLPVCVLRCHRQARAEADAAADARRRAAAAAMGSVETLSEEEMVARMLSLKASMTLAVTSKYKPLPTVTDRFCRRR